ncbi:MAG: ABC transporter ATP-binding protein [Clostridiales bacterium]|nr:ABC transporter ATP-binding protein [Clostridiales bacterium]
MPLLEVKHLHTSFKEKGRQVERIKDVSFHVDKGEVLCIVGESGCGKSVTALSVMDLLPTGGKITAGEVIFDGTSLVKLKEKAMDQIRGNTLTMIFQDALTALNPVLTIGKQLTEAIEIHLKLPEKQAVKRGINLLEKVGLPDPVGMMKRYPHTLSGGMRQRVMIAMAMACKPKLLIADEPTTALDVTIQAQIMDLLKTVQKEEELALILITHDIGVVAEMADRVMVMYAGEVVEEGSVWEVFDHPKHPYTQGLFASVPDMNNFGNLPLKTIKGTVPENYDQMEGCRFFYRCPYKSEPCHQPQRMNLVGQTQQVRCWCASQREGGCEESEE